MPPRSYGFRPLALGNLNGSFVVASETCAFDILEANFIREIEPGELIVIDDKAIAEQKVKSYRIFEKTYPKSHCVFEHIYFSRPDSFIFGHNVDKMRRRLGKALAKNHPVRDKDGEKLIVISVPDSSNTTALGYQKQIEKDGILSKLEIGLIRSHYIGRTSFSRTGKTGNRRIRIKFNTVKGVLEGRTVVMWTIQLSAVQLQNSL